MRKIIFKRIISVIMVLLLIVNLHTNAQAVNIITDDWISKCLSDYEPVQTMLNEYPETKIVQSDTIYILTDNTKDKSGNIIKTKQKKFLNQSSMDEYEKNLKNKDSEINSLVGNGDTLYHTYSKIKVGLRLYDNTYNTFVVACVFDWIDGFDYDPFFDYKAVVGLALGSGLSIDATTDYGRVTLTTASGNTIIRSSSNGGVNVQPTGISGIGYSIRESAVTNGLITDMQGVLSCTAYRTTSDTQFCSAYAEYAAVSSTLSLDSFSVSIPGGISFDYLTAKTAYGYQDTLDLR